jgi:hypothetical protein
VQSLTTFDEINTKLISFIIQSKTSHPNTELILRTEVEVFESEAKNNPLYLCQIIIILTAIGTNYEKFMMRVCELDDECQELWSDIIGKNINLEYENEEQSEKCLTLMSIIKELKESNKSVLITKSERSKTNENKLKEQNISLHNQLKECLLKIKNYEQAVSSLQNQIKDNQSNYKEEIQKLISNSHNIKTQSKNEIENLTKQIKILENNAVIITKDKIIKELTINDIMNGTTNNEIKEYIINKDKENKKLENKIKQLQEELTIEKNKNKICVHKEQSEINEMRTTLLDVFGGDKDNKGNLNVLKSSQLNQNKQIQCNNNASEEIISNLQNELQLLKAKEESTNKKLSLIKKENVKLNIQIDQLQEKNNNLSEQINKLSKTQKPLSINKQNKQNSVMKNKDITSNYNNINNLFSKYFKINEVNEQEIKNISDKLLTYKIEIKNLKEINQKTQKINGELNEELIKIKKNINKNDYDKVKLKQEINYLKKAILEMNNKSKFEHEIVTNSLGTLAEQFKSLKNKVS